MKNIIVLVIIAEIIAGVFAIIFGFYAFFGFMTWIFNDPFHWISPPPQERFVESPDVLACRAKGGFAILSGWTGGLKECQIPKI